MQLPQEITLQAGPRRREQLLSDQFVNLQRLPSLRRTHQGEGSRCARGNAHAQPMARLGVDLQAIVAHGECPKGATGRASPGAPGSVSYQR